MENKLFPSLYITDLREECNEATLVNELAKINIKLSSVMIYRNSNSHQSYGSGKLTFFTLREAEQALELFNYTPILGRPCRLMWFKKDKSMPEMTNSNIFIRNLEKSVTVKELYNEFSKYGTIFSCKIGGLKKPPWESKGYAYVQYENEENAQKAISSAHHTQIKGKQIQVTLFVKKSLRYEDRGPLYNNIYVKFIPRYYDNAMLEQLFENAGEITSAVVIYEKEEKKENKGFGFVCFKNAEDAKQAETDYNGKEVEGQKLFVCKSLSKEERKSQLKEERLKLYKNCNLYLKFIPPYVTTNLLKNKLQIYGQIVSARIFQENKFYPILNESKLTSLGYGFVCFSNEKEGRNALEGIKSNKFFGVQLYVSFPRLKKVS
jgi:polyadenylate-binding protein